MTSGKRAIGAIVLAAGASCSSLAFAADMVTMPAKVEGQSADQSWTASFNSEARWFSWRNTRGSPNIVAPLTGYGSGSQLYIPMSLSVTGKISPDWKIDFLLRGGYVSANQSTSGNRGSVSTTTDTMASSTVTYNGLSGFQPFVALLVNMPSGKSALYGSSRFARMDSDLVDIGSFGEGWNFGSTAGVNIPITQALMLTLSGGYTVRNKFDKEAADPITRLITATSRIKNGNEATVTSGLGYSQGAFSAQGSASYSWDDVSQVNEFGNPVGFNRYREGPRTTLSASVSYAWTDRWSSDASAFWTHTNRNEILGAGTALIPESFNSNNDVFRINAGLTYTTANGISTGPIASYLYRNQNSWSPSTFDFLPAKTRVGIGGVVAYNVTNKINVNGRIERIWIRENEIPGPFMPPPIIPMMSGDAWQLAVGATALF